MLRSAVVLLLALGLLVPSAAYAEKWGADDPAGDVHGSTFDPEPKPCGTITDWNSPANAAVDITRLSVTTPATRWFSRRGSATSSGRGRR